MSTVSPESAKQFLMTKLEEQALRDAVPLADIEKKMFLFSEASASEEMMAAALEFNATVDESDYEKKVSRLLRKVYRHDQKSSDGAVQWKQSLRALKNEEFYGMVMIAQAGLPVPSAGSFESLLEDWPYAAITIVIGLPGFLLVFDPFHWGLIRSDSIKVLLLFVFVVAIWYATQRYFEATFPKPRKRIDK